MDATIPAKEVVKAVVQVDAKTVVWKVVEVAVKAAAEEQPLHQKWIHFKEVKPWRIRLS